MEKNLYRYIFKHSMPQQLLLLVMTGFSFPFLYAFLELPKIIMNEAIQGTVFPRTVFGLEFDQIPYLFALCGVFLGLVVVNQSFKYVINVYKGLLAERMLRRLRYDLFQRVLRFPLPHFRRTSSGEIIPMITSEVEPLGGFIGDAIALPAYQGGTLLTILAFLFVQEPMMGIAAVALYPLQIYIIPKLQKRVNLLGKERVRLVRKLSDRIGETVASVQEVHVHDASALELTDFSSRLNDIFDVRYQIYRKKFFVKFLNNFLAQLGPFFFYSIGGYLVIEGSLSIGALIAVIAAYKDLYAPWKELLSYYQMKEDARIKYEQVTSQFEPRGLMELERLEAEPEEIKPLRGDLVASNVRLTDDGEIQLLDGVNARFTTDRHVAIVGRAGSGRHEFALLLARVVDPTGGRISIAGQDLRTLPEAVTGRRLAFAMQSTTLIAGSLRDSILYSLKHRPVRDLELEEQDDEGRRRHEKYLDEAKRSGNSTFDPDADWVDLDAAGVEDHEALVDRLIDVLDIVRLRDDVFGFGLKGSIDPKKRPELAEQILKARHAFLGRLNEEGLADLVEPLVEDRYNTNASLAENLLFGTPIGTTFDIANIAEQPYVRSVLDEVGLSEDLVRIGRDIASTMVELFADLPPDHEFFDQFSFIEAEDLPDFQMLIKRSEKEGLDTLAEEDRTRLLALPFRMIPARHRLGLIDESLRARIVEARGVFAAKLPQDLSGEIEFFDKEKYNAASSLQDNILFGKIAYGQAHAQAQIGARLNRIIDELDLRRTVIEVGLNFQVGIGGGRLSAAQRQKVALARCVVKRPDVLVLSEAAASLDASEQGVVLANLKREFEGRCIIWALQRPAFAPDFDYVLVMRGGRVVEAGTADEIDREDSLYRELVKGG